MDDNATNDVPGVIAPPPLIFALPLVVGLTLHLVRPRRVLPPALARTLGAVLLPLSGTLAVTAVREMHRAGTDFDPRKPSTALVTSGPYRVSRNPLYLSLTLLYAGITLRVNALWPVVFSPLVLLVMRWGVIDREEGYLERRFGNTYSQYTGRVRRWI